MLSRNLKSKEAGWAPLESMDRLRRWQGEWAEALGLGSCREPVTGSAQRASDDSAGLWHGVRDQGPVVLIVPAPIKRAYIWDLLPRASVVQQFARSGARVYLLQWERPGAAEQEFGLAEYAERP